MFLSPISLQKPSTQVETIQQKTSKSLSQMLVAMNKEMPEPMP